MRYIRHAAIAWAAAIFSLVAANAAAAPPRITDETIAAVEAKVAEVMDAMPIPGMAVALVQDGQTVFAEGYGVVDDTGAPVTPDTLFNVASLSKSATSLALVQLAEAGKVDLDLPVVTYLPGFRTADKAQSDQITLRQLMSHQSGISTAFGRRSLDVEVVRDRTAFLDELAKETLVAEPGAWWEYSNGNYWVLGHVIEAVTGAPYGAHVEEALLRPIGMAASSLSPALPEDPQALAAPHRIWFAWPRQAPRGGGRMAMGASDLLTSASDMARYLGAVMTETGPIPEGAVEIIAAPSGYVVELDEGPTKSIHSGLGWSVRGYDGYRVLNHGGSERGYRASMAFSPEGQSGVVVMTNTGEGYFAHDVYSAVSDIRRLAMGEPLVGPKDYTQARLLLGGLGALILLCVAGLIRLVAKAASGTLVRGGPGRFFVGGVAPSAVMIAGGPALALGLPKVSEATLSTALKFQPDAGWSLVAAGAALSVTGLIRLFLIGGAQRRTTAAPSRPLSPTLR